MPFKLEDQGEYDAEATAYTRDGFEKCLESHFRMNGDTRVGITMLLQAISCDHRADNRGRAERLFQIVESLIADAESQAETEVLRGILNEWRGDGRLCSVNLKRSTTIETPENSTKPSRGGI